MVAWERRRRAASVDGVQGRAGAATSIHAREPLSLPLTLERDRATPTAAGDVAINFFHLRQATRRVTPTRRPPNASPAFTGTCTPKAASPYLVTG